MTSSSFCTGGSHAWRLGKESKKASRFPGQDQQFCQDMIDLKRKFQPRTSEHFLRIRHSDCTTSAEAIPDFVFKRLGRLVNIPA